MEINYQHPRARGLLDRAEEALLATTALRLDAQDLEEGADTKAYLRRPDGTRHGPWYLDIKRSLQQRPLAALAAQIKHGPQPGLLVTEHVNPHQADTLRELNLPFIDTAGNAFVQDTDLYVYVTGRRRPDGYDPRREGRAFRPTELKLVLLFLCDPDALNTPYRALAARADIALGNVAQTVRVLEAQRYLVRPTRRERRLANRRELLDRWVTDYIARLRPGLVLGRYEARKPRWWGDVDLQSYGGRWGGEIAAAHWTRYLKPATATVYIDDNPAMLLLERGLVKNAEGDTELLRRFWPSDLETEEGFVPPPIAYADLLAIGGARNMETATELFEAQLAPHFPNP
ncbi:MAG: type IV toxin-antitoxin system AbiEi family antitoxin [Gammaproteobacteria bacterium]